MKKKSLLTTVILLLIAVFAFTFAACDNGNNTLESLKNEYGIVVDGGSFEEGSILVSNEIAATTEEATEVLTAIATQNYNKDGSVYIFDIYVTKDGVKVQPNDKVKVSVPIPNVQVDNYLVFHVKADNSVENLVSTVTDGVISFEVDSFSYFVIAEKATEVPECTEHTYGTDGKCTVCGFACVHTEVIDAAVAATCTTAGKTEGKHCSVCDTVIVAQTEVAALDHTEVIDAAVAATCTTAGKTEGKHCSVCDEVIVAQTEVAALGHTEVIDAAVAATCTTAGKTEGKHCSVCDEVIVAQTEVAALGHTEVIDAAVAATCTTAGKTEGKHCSVCDEVIVAQTEVAALGHAYVWVEGKISTCTEEGIASHYNCEGCGKNFDENYGEIDSVALPLDSHEYGDMYYELPPNFFRDGNIAYYQCETCKNYFDEEYNEVKTVVIPKYSTNLSICVNGTPTALTLDEQNENQIIWSLEGLSVTKGDVITLCQTDNAEISHNYFAEGNVDTDGKILTTAAAANVVLTSTDNGLMLFIDGYKFEGVVIEINGEQYPMNFVTYPDSKTTSYVYGYVNFVVGDKFVIVDNVSGTVYDYADLDSEFAWNTWDFHRGDNGEFVIDYAARYGIEFDNNGNKKIYITKAFAPCNGESFGMVFDGEREDVILSGIELPVDDGVDNEFMWTLTHCTTMNNADIVKYIGENGLWFYYTMIDLEAGEKFSLKNFTTSEIIGADHLVDITGDITAVTRKGDLVSVEKSGSFYIIYLPAFNAFTIECDTSDPLAEIILAAGDKTVTLIPDENGDIIYTAFESKTYHVITIFDSKYSSLPIILDEAMDKTLVNLTVSDDTYYAFPTKDGIYNLRYNVYKNVLYLEYVGESGSGENTTDDYLYYLYITNGSSDNQTLSMQINPNNSKEVYYQGATINASYFISVMEIAKDASSNNSYGAIADTDSSIAQSYGTIAMVKIAGTYDVYFDTEAKTIKLVAMSGSTEEKKILYTYTSKELTLTLYSDNTSYFTELIYSADGTISREEGESSWYLADGKIYAKTVNGTEYVFTATESGELVPYEEAECKHEKTYTDSKDATCTEGGYTKVICAECDEIVSENYTEAFGHSYVDGKCSACGETEGGDIVVPDVCKHEKIETISTEATCTEAGYYKVLCTECGEIVEEKLISEAFGHSFGDWTPDEVDDKKHYKECECGEVETAACSFDENGTCTVCGREKTEEADGIIIVISGGTATFEGKETVTSNSKLYGEKAIVYIAQQNDVLNVTLNDQEGRTFKYWVSATGTIIPDEDFSMLVVRSGYYYPIFEDVDTNAFSNRAKIYEGNCEEGVLYMSTNSKGDIKYELEFVNYGRHDFAEYVNHNSQYHKQVCSICGESIFESHDDYMRETEKEPTHTEEGLRSYECFCGHVWTEAIPATDEHSVDYDDWRIVEESKNGQYGKYRVYCKYCDDYYEEYWYLGGLDFVSFIDGKMINYQYTYGGKVSHDEYYYSYRNAEGKKVYIWAFQYEYAYASNADYNDTYIFMYVDDENSTTIEPIYLSKSKGDRKAEYLWAIYGYAHDVNDWMDLLHYPDRNIGCSGGIALGNSMSARASVLESYHDQWADTYNKLRIPTSKAYDDLSDTEWELYFESESFGGRDTIGYVRDKATSLQKYFYVDKATGITYGYEDFGTAYRTVFIMRQYKTIVSPEEFEKLDEAGKSVSYSYGDIEKDIKSLCAKRMAFNNFTLTVPKEASAFRLSVDFIIEDGLVDLGGYYASVYYNTAQVFDSGKYITFTWIGGDDLVFDRYEIWDFVNQKWVVLSESPDFTFNTEDNPRRDAAYVRVVYHEVEIPVEPSVPYTITVENGYFEIDGEEYTGTVEVAANTLVYVYANDVAGKTFEHWLDGNGDEFYNYSFNVTSDMTLTPVYVDTVYNIYCEGWNYDSYVSVNSGEAYHYNEFEGKIGDKFELSTSPDPKYGCTVFIGWYMETYGMNGYEYILISDKQAFTYQITGEEQGCLYAVWTTGENPFVKTYVDIRVTNGFVSYAGGEVSENFDNAYSAISVSNMGRVTFYDDPTDEIDYKMWDIAYRYDLEGEVMHDISESFEDEYDYYPAEYWVNDPQYSYPDGVINVTGTNESYGDLEEGEEVVLPE